MFFSWRASVVLFPLAVATCPLAAQEKPGDTITQTQLEDRVHKTLRHVLNEGARIYNEEKNIDGCCKYFQGALRMVGPILAHRVDVQLRIDRGLKEAAECANDVDRAFALHKTIGDVRDLIKKPDKLKQFD